MNGPRTVLALLVALLQVALAVPAAEAEEPRAPQLLFDLDTRGSAALPVPGDVRPVTSFTTAGERALFTLWQPETTSVEVWGSDGTPGGTRPVLQPCLHGPFPCFASVSHTGATPRLAFLKVSPATGGYPSLWRSDGTPGGTYPLTGPMAPADSFGPALVAGTRLLFTRCRLDGTACALWSTDGTVAGTNRISQASPFGLFGKRGEEALFLGGDAKGSGLWRSDGTRTGTRLIHRLPPQWLHSFAVTGRQVFFMGGEYGEELWSSDGTAAGLRRLALLAACSERFGCSTRFLGTAGDTLFLVSAGQVWRSDGTPQGTLALGGVPAGSLSVARGTVVGGRLLYVAPPSPGAAAALWSAGPRDRRLQPLAGCAPPCPSFPRPVFLGWDPSPRVAPTQVASTQGAPTQGAPTQGAPTQGEPTPPTRAFLATTTRGGRLELWASDGTGAGTRRLAVAGPAGRELRWVHVRQTGNRCFLALSFADGIELWASDGSPAATRRVAVLSPVGDLYAGFADLAVAGERALFAGWDPQSGLQPWASDGTAAGTAPLAFVTHPGTGSAPRHFAALAGGVALRGCDGERTALWRSDGEPGHAPALLLDEGPGCRPRARESKLVSAGGRIFFTEPDAGADVGVRQLWTSDGTAGGTQPLTTFVTYQAGPPFPLGATIGFFASPLGAGPAELWRSDGTAAGTTPLFPLADSLADVQTVHPLGDRVYFAARDAHAGLQFFTSDGTAAGTVRITPVGPQLLHGYGFLFFPPRFARLGEQAFFGLCPPPPDARCGLWRTRGTLASTELVYADPQAAYGYSGRFAVLGSRLLFACTTGLCSSDGTVEGSGPLAAVPIDPYLDAELTTVGDHAFFVAFDGEHGTEPWVSDGTAAGTRVIDLQPGPSSSSPRRLLAWGGSLWLTAVDADGRELWRIDLLPGGEVSAQRVADLAPGTLSSDPTELTPLGDRLLFSAADPQLGREPWVVEAAAAP